MNEEQKYIDVTVRNKKIDFVKEIVSGYYKQPFDDFERRVRKREIIKLKYVAIYLILERVTPKIGISLAELGSLFGGYDHATVLHAKRQIAGYLAWDKDLEKEVNELVALIHHKLTFVNGKLNLNEDYHYVNLNDCVSVKQSDIRGVVFWGYTLKEANDMIEKIGIANSPQFEFKNTGTYLLKKIEKNDGKTDEWKPNENAEKPTE